MRTGKFGGLDWWVVGEGGKGGEPEYHNMGRIRPWRVYCCGGKGLNMKEAR